MTATVLITRPAQSGLQLADQLRNRWGCKIPVVLSPLMKIVPEPDLPDLRQAQALIFTSKHAVERFAQSEVTPHIPCFTVGSATAAMARRAGFEVTDAGGDADDLVRCIRSRDPKGPLWHLRGEHTTGRVIERLNALGIDAHEAVVYRQEALSLTQEALQVLDRECPVILPLFSPRSARLFFSQVRPSAPLLVAALSDNVARYVPSDVVGAVRVAHNPTNEALVDVMDKLLVEAQSG